MKSRKEYLDELMIGIFGVIHVRDVRKNSDEFGEIVFDKGLIDQCTFSGSYKERIQKVLELTFLKGDTIFHKGNVVSDFNRSKAVKNTIEYFKRYDISLSIDSSLALESDEQIFSNFLYKEIITYIFPVLFGSDVGIKIT